jgi:Fe(3+) dicitrate transport protein
LSILGLRLNLFLVAATMAWPLWGQQDAGELRLTVVDPSGSPVEVRGELRGATALTRFAFVTDGSGKAALASLPFGTYQLKLTRLGFETQEATIEIGSPAPVERVFTLQVSAIETSLVVSILPGNLEGIPGSTGEITRADLDATRPLSIKEALRRSPGVHVVDEDAFGLNLNIGLRGLNPRRTQRTLLLEDGVPIHLAPYSDPSAHYHTPPELLESIEFIKGSGEIVHGPQTVGGVINMVTEPAPNRFRSSFGAVLGNRDFRSVDGKLGTGDARGGILGHVVHREGNGVREGHSHAITHLGLRGLLRLSRRQSLQLQTSYYEENSNFSEAGMAEARYEANPFDNPFRNDRFELQRVVARALHAIELDEGIRLSTSLYYQKIDRASYRQTDDSTDQMTANPETGCTGAARLDYDSFAALCGNKMRPRNYDFWGIEPRLQIRRKIFGVTNETNAGMRFHRENVTRRRFNGITPAAREDSPGTLLRDWNEIEATAVPAYFQSSFLAGLWSFTPGVRVERISSRNRARRFNFNRVDVRVRDTQTVVLPGAGLTYFGLPRTTLFTGVHKGFAPPRPDENLNPTDPNFFPVSAERSTNYEAGVRSLPLAGVQMEFTLFRLDFRNQIVPGDSVGQPLLTWANAGRTRNEGGEIGGRLDLGSLLASPHNFYLTAAYTYLFTARFDSDSFNGPVNVRGNRLPYAPRHLFSPTAGYSHRSGVNVTAGIEHLSEQFAGNLNDRVPSANGLSGTVPSFSIVHAAVNVPLRAKGPVLFLSLSNLADRRYIVSRVDGIHPGRPRQVFGGLRWSF